MRFEHPQILYLLFALPLVGFFFVASFHVRRRRLERFASPAVLDRLTQTVSLRKRVAKAIGLLTAIGLIIVALARPQWGSNTRPIETHGLDIIIAIDTSRSMLAKDMPIDRLTRAKQQLRGIIRRARGDRVGIVAFAGAAFMQCPLTLDYGLALNTLNAIDVDTIPVQGTAIGAAIDTAVEAFERSSPKGAGRVLALLTDGEDQGSNPLQAASKAAQAGVTIYTVGIGGPEGNPIPEDGKFKKDDQGAIVNTRLDAETLTNIALATSGKYIQSNPSGMLELEEVFSGIEKMQKAFQESKQYVIHTERFPWIILLAAAILAWEAIQDDRRSRLGDTREKHV